MKKIILVEDQQVVRNALKMLLESNQRYEVIAEAGNGQEALDFIDNSSEAADLILSDIAMPVMDGLTMLKTITKRPNFPPVVILSMSDGDQDFSSALFQGAAGYLSKSVSSLELFFALDRICTGKRYFSADLSINILESCLEGKNLRDIAGKDFSGREIDIIRLISLGLTNSEIAEKLFLSKRTIESHRQQLIEKTGAINTAALIRFACLTGIIS